MIGELVKLQKMFVFEVFRTSFASEVCFINGVSFHVIQKFGSIVELETTKVALESFNFFFRFVHWFCKSARPNCSGVRVQGAVKFGLLLDENSFALVLRKSTDNFTLNFLAGFLLLVEFFNLRETFYANRIAILFFFIESFTSPRF